MALNIKKTSAVPQPDGQGKYLSETLYFVSSGATGLELWLTSQDGNSIRHIPTQAEILGTSVLYADEAPELPNQTKLWLHTETFTLYVQYDDGDTVQWVEAIPSYAVPEFAGTGVAATMARSDHNHDNTYASIGAKEW